MTDLPGTVSIVGAGTMGAGIAQVALEAGWAVVLFDVDATAVERGRRRIRDGLVRRVAKLDLGPTRADDWVMERFARLRDVPILSGLVDGVDLVVECALEDLVLKRTIFRTLGAADPGVILATNTSALAVSDITVGTVRPERVLGLHFFNPAPLMALVEVVASTATDPVTVSRAVSIIEAWGKTPVACADRPGFIVNRVNRPFTIEALRILEEGAADIETIDQALRSDGFPMGPFELMDLTGIDVTLAASTAIWERLDRPDRLRPSPIQKQLVAAGRLGRKTGSGFYHYVDGRTTVAVTGTPIGSRPAGGTSPLDPAAIGDRIQEAIRVEAQQAVDEGIASPATIDLAMRLGAGHPRGPFAATIRP